MILMSDADRIDMGAYTPEFAMFRPQLFPIGGHCKDFQELSFQLVPLCNAHRTTSQHWIGCVLDQDRERVIGTVISTLIAKLCLKSVSNQNFGSNTLLII